MGRAGENSFSMWVAPSSRPSRPPLRARAWICSISSSSLVATGGTRCSRPSSVRSRTLSHPTTKMSVTSRRSRYSSSPGSCENRPDSTASTTLSSSSGVRVISPRCWAARHWPSSSRRRIDRAICRRSTGSSGARPCWARRAVSSPTSATTMRRRGAARPSITARPPWGERRGAPRRRREPASGPGRRGCGPRRWTVTGEGLVPEGQGHEGGLRPCGRPGERGAQPPAGDPVGPQGGDGAGIPGENADDRGVEVLGDLVGAVGLAADDHDGDRRPGGAPQAVECEPSGLDPRDGGPAHEGHHVGAADAVGRALPGRPATRVHHHLGCGRPQRAEPAGSALGDHRLGHEPRRRCGEGGDPRGRRSDGRGRLRGRRGAAVGRRRRPRPTPPARR